MAMTEHHFVLLFQDKVKVIRMLDDRVVYEEPLDIVSLFNIRCLDDFSRSHAD